MMPMRLLNWPRTYTTYLLRYLLENLTDDGEILKPLFDAHESSNHPPRPSYDDPDLELDPIKCFVLSSFNKIMSIRKTENQEVVLDYDRKT